MTAVISKTEHEFQKWCIKNPRYPDKVCIMNEHDVKGRQFFFVKNTAEAPKMPNFRKLMAYCEARVILVIAVIAKDEKDMKKYNSLYYKQITSIEDALQWRFSSIIVGKSARKLVDWQDIVEFCESRRYSE